MKAIFLVGCPPPSNMSHMIQKKIEEEQLRHCDLLQFNFIENLFNNTLKQLHALQYLYQTFNTYPGPPEYILQTDDDLFINIPMFDKLLKAVDEKRG